MSHLISYRVLSLLKEVLSLLKGVTHLLKGAGLLKARSPIAHATE